MKKNFLFAVVGVAVSLLGFLTIHATPAFAAAGFASGAHGCGFNSPVIITPGTVQAGGVVSVEVDFELQCPSGTDSVGNVYEQKSNLTYPLGGSWAVASLSPDICDGSGVCLGTFTVDPSVAAGTYYFCGYINQIILPAQGGSPAQHIPAQTECSPIIVTPAAPTVSLTSSANPITLGSSITLTWSSTNATSCAASSNSVAGGWSGAEPASGASTDTPSAVGTATYTLTCTGPGGNTTVITSVIVNAAAAVPAPAGTITFSSENSQLNTIGVPAQWDINDAGTAGAVDVCTEPGATCSGMSESYANQLAQDPSNLSNTFGDISVPQASVALGNSVPVNLYSFDSIQRAPSVQEKGGVIDSLLSLTKDIFGSTAEAWTPLAANPLQQLLLPNGTVNFVILWDPNADMSLSQSTLSPSATAGGSSVSNTISVTNTGAPGSTLTWTATVNASSSSWLSASPSADANGVTNGASGNASDNVTISANPSSLSAGAYSGTIEFDGYSKDDTGNPQLISKQILTVNFTVNSAVGGGSTAGYNCSNGNSCVYVNSGATYPDPGGAASCAAACNGGGNGNPGNGNPGNGGAAPVCTLSATPGTVIIPQQSTLSYNCSGVTSCSISGGSISSPIKISGNASNIVNGTTNVSPTTNSTYTISCSGPGGSTSATAVVNVGNTTICESNPGGVNCPGAEKN
jgi:hypothetical protein